MVTLSKIRFTDERGRQLTYTIPNDNQIEFDFNFGSIKEEVGFVGGYLIALLPDDEGHEKSKRYLLNAFAFQTKSKNEVWFKIPPAASHSYHVNKQESVDLVGTHVCELITAEFN